MIARKRNINDWDFAVMTGVAGERDMNAVEAPNNGPAAMRKA